MTHKQKREVEATKIAEFMGEILIDSYYSSQQCDTLVDHIVKRGYTFTFIQSGNSFLAGFASRKPPFNTISSGSKCKTRLQATYEAILNFIDYDKDRLDKQVHRPEDVNKSGSA